MPRSRGSPRGAACVTGTSTTTPTLGLVLESCTMCKEKQIIVLVCTCIPDSCRLCKMYLYPELDYDYQPAFCTDRRGRCGQVSNTIALACLGQTSRPRHRRPYLHPPQAFIHCTIFIFAKNVMPSDVIDVSLSKSVAITAQTAYSRSLVPV